MLTPADLHPYQRNIGAHVLAHKYAMVWSFMGSGKTVSTLTAVADLLDRGHVRGALVVAPLRVAQTVWRQEADNWEHLRGLTFSLIHGESRKRELALRKQVNVYLINYEGLPWLWTKLNQLWARKGIKPPFNLLVLDEVTRAKNVMAQRTMTILKMRPFFDRCIGLTGEPAPNGYADLFGQFLCIDGGKRLGASLTSYRETFLRPTGYMGYQWEATRSGRKRIRDRIADITLQLDAKDYLQLPEVIYNVVKVELPSGARKIYDTLEKEFFAELEDGADLEVANEAAKINKLLQVASGAAYLTTGGPWSEIHKTKLQALEDILEEAGGSPVLCGYSYIHEAERMEKAFPAAKFLSSKLNEIEVSQTLRDWESGRVPLLCGHPASMGHGLNLSGGEPGCSTVAWLSLPWSLELYRQLNARIIGGHRRKRASVVHHIVAKDTVDELVMAALQQKHQTQEGLKRAVAEYRDKRGL